MFISVLLLANFVISILQSELDVEANPELGAKFDIIEMTFTVLYLGELLLNMYGHWFWDFFLSGWNWFDVVIVSISVPSV
jgi:hypothetical protein